MILQQAKTSYSSLRATLRRKNVKAGISSLIFCTRWTSHSHLSIIFPNTAPGTQWTGEWYTPDSVEKRKIYHSADNHPQLLGLFYSSL